MSADAAAAANRPADRQASRRASSRFPLPMALLMSLIARLPDAVVARLVRVEAGPEPGRRSVGAIAR